MAQIVRTLFIQNKVQFGALDTSNALNRVKITVRYNRIRRTKPVENILSLLLCVLLGVETLLCYLELHPQRFVELLHPTLSACKISCYDGPRQLQKITKMYEMSYVFVYIFRTARFSLYIGNEEDKLKILSDLSYFTFHSCPPVAVVLARRRMAGERVESCDQVEFDVVEVADTMGWQLPLVKRGLRQLQWSSGNKSLNTRILDSLTGISC